MGIDGRQFLEIRGMPYILDQLEQTGIVFIGGNPVIANRFFGSAAEVSRKSPRYLVVNYEYRNQPVYEYLRQLLDTHPTLWIKNSYTTEIGLCGLWIGRTMNGAPAIQELEWTELTTEEEMMVEDFSIQSDVRGYSLTS